MSFEGSYVWRLRQQVGRELLVMPAVHVLLLDAQGRIYLQVRTDFGQWEVPSGSCEPGDTFVAAARREVLEETGLVVDPEGLAAFAAISEPAVQTITYPNGDRTHYFSLGFVTTSWSGTPSPDGTEATEFGFFEIDDLPSPILPSTATALRLYARFVRSGTFQIE